MAGTERQPAASRSTSTAGTLLSGIASAVLIVLFFAPWLTACGVQVSAMDLATSQQPSSMDQGVEGQPSPSWLLGIPAVGVVGLLVALSALNKPVAVVKSRARLNLLLSFYPLACVAILYMGIKGPPQEGQMDLRPLVQLEYGFWGTALAALLLLLGAIMDMGAAREESVAAMPSPQPSPGPGHQAELAAAPAKPATRPPPTPSPPPPPRAWLEGRSGEWAGQRFDISHTMIAIGRHHTSDLRLVNKAVSRRHALIRSGQGRYFVQDQGSAIGTFVNGQRVDACEIKSGDVIRIGETELEFHVH